MNTSQQTCPAPVTLIPVTGLPELRRGDDLVALLAAALGPDSPAPAADGDVLCVSAKIVSKCRGLVVEPSRKAEAIRAATVRPVLRRRHGSVVTSVVETTSGPVLAAAGIDASNSPDGLLLLPEDPDAEARALRHGLERRLGLRLAVVLTDTASRIWRTGVTDIALGAAGLEVLQDLRGGTDAVGRPLGVTVRALADELAGAADLVKGKSTGTPVAIVRHLGDRVGRRESSARELVRTGPDDWFRRPSLESVWQALGLAGDAEPVAAMSPEPDDERIARAIAVACTPRAGDAAAPASEAGAEGPRVERAADGAVLVIAASARPEACLRAGELAERLRTALGAESIARELGGVEVRVQIPPVPDVLVPDVPAPEEEPR